MFGFHFHNITVPDQGSQLNQDYGGLNQASAFTNVKPEQLLLNQGSDANQTFLDIWALVAWLLCCLQNMNSNYEPGVRNLE